MNMLLYADEAIPKMEEQGKLGIASLAACTAA
jgi:hypothetical protein